MKVLKGTLVDHTTKEDLGNETRFYKTTDESIAKNDIVVVWAHGRLGFMKVKAILETFEYLASENNDTILEDVPLALNKVNNEEYKINKAFLAKKRRIEACIEERIEDGKIEMEISEAIKEVTPEKKEEIKALQAQLKALIADPKSALDD